MPPMPEKTASDDETVIFRRTPERPDGSGANGGIGALVVRYYRGAILALVGLVAYGAVAWLTLPRTEDPEYPTFFCRIVTLYPGADASKVETFVTKPIEDALEELDAVKLVRAQSTGGLSFVLVDIRWDEDPEDTMDEIRKKMKEIEPDLPEGIVTPEIRNPNFGDIPVLILGLQGPYDYAALGDFGERLKDAVARLPGVSKTRIEARPERQILVDVNLDRLGQYRIPLLQLRDAIALENAGVPGGKLDIGATRYLLKSPNEYSTLRDLRRTVVGSHRGALVFLEDVATVEEGFEQPRYVARTNGEPTVLLTVQKTPNENTSAVAAAVLARIDEVRPTLPADLRIDVINDRGRSVDELLGNLGNNALAGAALVMLAVGLAFGVRQALLVSVSIPLSILISFVVMKATGTDLNQLSIFGLALALGNIVDASMVVIENVTDHLERGEPLGTAVVRGTNEMAMPILASVLTSAAAFVPLLFLTGSTGPFIRPMPMTVIFATLASYVVAIVVMPLLCMLLFRGRQPSERSSAAEREPRYLSYYVAILRTALRHRALTLVAAVVILAASLLAIPRLGIEFFPKAEKKLFLINIRLPREASLQATDRVAEQVEKILAAEAPVKNYTVNVGKGSPWLYYNEPRENEKPNYGQVVVNLKDDYEGRTEDYVAGLRDRLGAVSGGSVEARILEQKPGGEAAVEVRFLGEDRDVLARLAAEARQRIAGVPGAADVRDNMGPKSPRLLMDLDKEKAGLLGVSSFTFARTIFVAVNGEEATKLRDGDDEVPVVVRASPRAFEEVSGLGRLTVSSAGGEVVPFSEVARVRSEEAFSQLNHRNGTRSVAVQMDAVGRQAIDLQRDVEARLRGFAVPSGYRMEIGGEEEERQESFESLGSALVFGMLLIYGILALQFNSFVQPFVIVLTIPFGVVGAILGLWLTGNPFGFMAFLGIVSLSGIVITDSILLADGANFAQRVEGKGLYESLLLAGRRRFKPVMLTSLTTIVDLIPAAIWGGSLWSPLANAMIFGDLLSTFLILVVMPVIYAVLVRPGERHRRYRLVPTLWQRLLGRSPGMPPAATIVTGRSA
ncbi:MAG: multidrug efflux pump [Candidatus Binatota bacterium]|jgi:multidrug efflux pump subunit AcrB|nr:multidrug efflux pump [Candidatus Binatota bacterium]